MVFYDWLNYFQNKFEIKNVELAHFSGLHPSTISRYRRGVKSPLTDRNHLNRIVAGIIQVATENNKLSDLRNFVNDQLKAKLVTSSSGSASCDQLSELYLLPGDYSILHHDLLRLAQLSLGEDPDLMHDYLPDFDQKIDCFMQLFSVSNARLANILNLDHSLISRWRSGIRTLKKDNPTLETLVAYIADTLTKAQKTDLPNAQQHFIQCIISDASLTVEQNILNWLQSSQQDFQIVRKNVENILEMINAWPGNKPQAVQLDHGYLQLLSDKKKQENYRGIKGLREAVIRFFTDIILSEEKRTLQLFSNQEMQWMAEDQRFLQTWQICMQTIINQGHQIEIIHNLGRSLEELTLGIEKWLPLHMNKNVTAYTCDRINLSEKNQNPLVKTLFIDVGNAAINAEMVKGTEDQSDYHYYTSSNRLKELGEQFEQLKQMSEPIMVFYPENTVFSAEILKESQIINQDQEENALTNELILLFPALPLCFFPQDIVKEILVATGLSSSTIKKIIEENKKLVRMLEDYIETGKTTVIGPFTDQLKTNPVVLLPDTNDTLEVELSEEQYRAGMESLYSYQENYPNFQIRPLVKVPFNNLHIISLNHKTIFLLKTKTPHLLIKFQHEISVICFNRYLESFI